MRWNDEEPVIDMEDTGTDNMTDQDFKLKDGTVPLIACYIHPDVFKDMDEDTARTFLHGTLSEVSEEFPMLHFGVAFEEADWDE
jgi:hypothetical protein